jgi:hypothetical protein
LVWCGLICDDVAAPVEFDFAAVEELVAHHGAAPLYTGFGAAGREPEAASHLILGESFEFGEGKSFSVDGGKPVDDFPEEGGESLLGNRDVGWCCG